MVQLKDRIRKIRSKNAGPFWLTIDIFCFDHANYETISSKILNEDVAALFQIDESALRRFDLPDLLVIKFSLPRPQIQGTAKDSDIHGAAYAALVEELEIAL